MAEDRWLSVAEISEHLGVQPSTIYKWLERKKMPAHKVGRLWKFQKDEVDEWVRKGKAGETSTGTTENQAETMPVKKKLKQSGGDNE